MRILSNSSLREEREKIELRKVILKVEGLFKALMKELCAIEPTARFRGGRFEPRAGGYGDSVNINLLGTTVTFSFRVVRARSLFHLPTGDVRITIGDWTHNGSKTFNDRKDGHDLKEIASYAVATAKRIIENDKKKTDLEARCEHLRTVAKAINAKHHVRTTDEDETAQVYAEPYVEVFSDGRLMMRMPYELSEEHADRLLGFMKKELGL